MVSDAHRNREIVEQLYAGFAAGDVEAVLANMAGDIAWTEAEGYPYAGTYVGPEAIVQGVFARLANEWDGYKAVPDSYVADGDTVVALGHYSGRYLVTDKSFRAPFAHVWTVRDGKLATFVQYTDTAVVRKALDDDAAG